MVEHCTKTSHNVSCWSDCAWENNTFTFKLKEPVHLKSITQSTFLPLNCGFFQIRSVFATVNATLDELFDIIIDWHPPSYIQDVTLQGVMVMISIMEFLTPCFWYVAEMSTREPLYIGRFELSRCWLFVNSFYSSVPLFRSLTTFFFQPSV